MNFFNPTGFLDSPRMTTLPPLRVQTPTLSEVFLESNSYQSVSQPVSASIAELQDNQKASGGYDLISITAPEVQKSMGKETISPQRRNFPCANFPKSGEF